MNKKEQVLKALELAYEKHNGQLDKAGKPYILHTLTLAIQCTYDDDKIVALLHDVVEDTDVTLDNLRDIGFDGYLVDQIGLLTRPKEMNYFDYIKGIAEVGLSAKYVKILDLKHNMDLSRIENVTQKDLDRVEKYKKALDILRGSM